MDADWEREHLWLYLLALGFDQNGSGGGGLVLGADMFDNPNSTAFHDVALFLFANLDEARAEETFKDCSFPIANYTDGEFRKKCCMWLKDIGNEDESCLPHVTPSAFISPSGTKFIHLFYQFARHVMVEDIKINSVGTDIPFAKAINLRPEDMYMANARCRVAYNKLLQIFQKEDFVIQEYEKKAQLLIKEIKQIESEYAALHIQSCKMKQNDQNTGDKTERIQKVRSMWTLIMEILTPLKKEKEVVDSVLDVLEDRVGQCILDGTNVVISVPPLLAHRVESDVQQLLNEVLRTLRDERCQPELKRLQDIENRITLCNKALQDLKAKRLEIEQQHSVSTSGPISRTQEDWEVKWKSFLGLCSFDLILDQDTELDLLRASPPHSLNLAEDDDEEDGVFCQHLVSVSGVYDSIQEVCYEKDDGALETMMDKSPSLTWISSVPLEFSKASENRDMLNEKNLHIETCEQKKKPVPPEILKNGKDESAISEMWENAGDRVKSPVRKEDPLNKARDELAEEVAKAVISESPQSDEGKGMALEDLISSLAFDPFLTRKQIPRTPENLLTEIRSSWRKAIQTEGSSDIELAPTEVITEGAPMDATPMMQEAADSRFICSIPASPVPDFDPSLSERKSQLSSAEFRLQEQMRVSHIIESPVLETCGMQESERTEKQELKCIVLKKSSVEDPEEQTFQYVKKSTNTAGNCSENNSRTDVLPSDHFRGSLMDGMRHWNVSPLLSSASCEASHLGISDETLPEELGNIESNKSASSESDFDVTDSTYITDVSENKGDIKKSKLDLQFPFNTQKGLKKTACRSEEELHQTRNESESVSCRSSLSFAPEKRERDELCGPLELFCLDEEFTKMLLPISLNERKYPLSSFLVSCQNLEEMASTVHEMPLDVIHKLKDKEQLNEKLDTEEPPSGQSL